MGDGKSEVKNWRKKEDARHGELVYQEIRESGKKPPRRAILIWDTALVQDGVFIAETQRAERKGIIGFLLAFLPLGAALDVIGSRGDKNVEINAQLLAKDPNKVLYVWRDGQQASRRQSEDFRPNGKIDFPFQDIDNLLLGVRVGSRFVPWVERVQDDCAAFCLKNLPSDSGSNQFPFHLFPVHWS